MPIFNADHQTQSAGTVITQVIPAVAGMIPRITDLVYEVAGTSHTLTIMRPIGTAVAQGNANTGQALVDLDETSPGKNSSGVAEVLAASDYLIWQDEDGTWQFDTVSSVSQNTVTMSNNFGVRVKAGQTFYACYEVGRGCHQVLTPKTSTRNVYNNLRIQAGVAGQIDQYNARTGVGDPLLFHSDNITAAGFLEQLSGEYVAASEVAML